MQSSWEHYRDMLLSAYDWILFKQGEYQRCYKAYQFCQCLNDRNPI